MKFYLFFAYSLLCIAAVKAQSPFKIEKIFELDANHSLYNIVLQKNASLIAVGESGFLHIKKDSGSFTIDTFYNLSNLFTVVNKQQQVMMLGNNLSYCNFNATGNEMSYLDAKPKQNYSVYASFYFKEYLYTSILKTGITKAKKVVPFGSINIYDNNINFVRKSKFPLNVIWDFYEQKENLFALKYNPIFKTRLLKLNNNKRWKKTKRYPYLLQKAFTHNDNILYCGAKNLKLNQGIIIINEAVFSVAESGVVWDVAMVEDMIIAIGNQGKIFYKTISQKQFNVFDTGYNMPLYDMVPINKKELIIVGHKGLVLKLTLP